MNTPRSTTAIALLLLAMGCSSTPLQGQPDCTGLPVPAIACLVGPTVQTCSRGGDGHPHWVITCPGENDGGSDGGDIGNPCGSTASCASGEICTTQDGVCNAPPGCGDGGACPAVCYGTCRAPHEDGSAPTAPCNFDGDCRLEADYCTGCDCRVLGAGQSVPACTGPGVSCLLDPCTNKTVSCVNGACVSP